ncbi:bacteriohemerythrin [Magnetospirillum sp. UT-4]|uniref:bacteriohemerythrin n=1 Tax=Magnetospirillum sp. UT-4 TaxID=2681467 RepID=UPI00138319D9|nr:bacteriohemerythrin [Magnetospirillum sp. UT-4]CAA7618679.1 putative Hemerythrin family protein [Magnetospirillum sp. UT-4]
MRTLHWDPSMAVGVDEFDRDHEHLLGLYNELFAVCGTGAGAAEVKGVLDRLLSYANDHFRREEEAMRAAGYPGTGAHEAAHDQLVLGLSRMREEIEHGRAACPGADALEFLHGWIVTHTLEMDKAYGPFLNTRGNR